LTDLKENLRRLKVALLKPYYLILFYYHLRMYKRAVKNAEGKVNKRLQR
jgi:hypothetical protein